MTCAFRRVSHRSISKKVRTIVIALITQILQSPVNTYQQKVSKTEILKQIGVGTNKINQHNFLKIFVYNRTAHAAMTCVFRRASHRSVSKKFRTIVIVHITQILQSAVNTYQQKVSKTEILKQIGVGTYEINQYNFLKTFVWNCFAKAEMTGAFRTAPHRSINKKFSETEIAHSTQILQSTVEI